MKPPLPHPKNGGIALVVILAFIVLLVILILAYFSVSSLHRQVSTASSSQALTAIFADGAANAIFSDLRQEIIAGSTDIVTDGGNPVYYPLSTTNIVPTRVGTSTNLPNLVKRSAYNLAFHPGGPSRAANSSTTNASQNGRFFPSARWNAPLLLPKADTTSATDLTPHPSFVAPDWIYVARNGSNPTTWNSDMRWNRTNGTTVVGRYAYAIYDEGGLIDINVAGYPPGSATNLIARKGILAAADLSVIPGMSTNAINALVGWRNYVTAEAKGSFPNYTFSGSGENYFKTARGNTSGFLRTANTDLIDGQSDRMFVSRQQLIQFLTQGVAANDPDRAALQNALQYLGTFTRDLEQPSFRPDPDRPKNETHRWATSGNDGRGYGGNDAYDPTGNTQDLVNPAVLSVRDDSGDPVLKRRFPLSRLGLIKPNPSPEEAEKILQYFGLRWNNTDNRWDYDHGTPNQILKLSEIPAGREPDFFEILKASINCDSIGKQYGGTDFSGKGNPSPHNYINDAAAVDGVINYQIMQIGANLIDQYDDNSYPTAIAFTDTRLFYGVENLPYLAGWRLSWYHMRQLTAADIDPGKQPPKAPGDVSVYPFETWAVFQPVLWNPHAPDPDLDTTKAPTQFRVTAGSMTGIGVTVNPIVRPSWWQSQGVSQFPAAGGLTPISWAQSTLSPTSSVLTFNAAPNTIANVPASFQEPYRLLYQHPAGTNADSQEAQGKFSLDTFGSIADPVLAAADALHDGKTIIGFFAGKCWAGPWNAMSTFNGSEPPNCLTSGYLSTNDLRFTLEYRDETGKWLPYDSINQVYASTVQDETMSTVDNVDSGTNVRAFNNGFRADPRTNRWGLFNMKTFPLASNPTSATGWPPRNGIHPVGVYNLPEGATLSPNAGDNTSFIYRLFRNAQGNPLVDWSTAPYLSDLMVNLQNGNTASHIPGRKFYYNDPDHVIRRADGAFFSNSDGLPLRTGNFNSRPVVLNRPFRSVAEMGYAFSGTPWRDINFFAPESGDAALLDAFCLNEADNTSAKPVVAGRVNLNTRQPKVLEALLSGVSKAEGGILTSSEARNAAQALVNWTTDTTSVNSNGILTKGPLRNRSELVGKFINKVTYASPSSSNTPNIGYDGQLSYSGYSQILGTGVLDVTADASIKRRREAILRGLTDSGTTRTWNLLIDVVAQTGRFPQHAGNLSQFVVEGETRNWVHLAIDRFTGEVIARQTEQVSE